MSAPKRIVIEYEDGSKKGIEINEFSRQARVELSRLGLLPSQPVIPKPAKNYVLLQWKDGWKEVIGTEKSTVELLRYYAIERSEEIGRLALEVAEQYPVLFLINRLPAQIQNILIVGAAGTKMYSLGRRKSRREGGKVEHVYYDSADLNSTKKENGSADRLVMEILGTLETELTNRGLTKERLLTADESEKVAVFRDIAKALGIRGMETAGDVYGFIQLMFARI
jgi:hypothetical protein